MGRILSEFFFVLPLLFFQGNSFFWSVDTLANYWNKHNILQNLCDNYKQLHNFFTKCMSSWGQHYFFILSLPLGSLPSLKNLKCYVEKKGSTSVQFWRGNEWSSCCHFRAMNLGPSRNFENTTFLLSRLLKCGDTQFNFRPFQALSMCAPDDLFIKNYKKFPGKLVILGTLTLLPSRQGKEWNIMGSFLPKRFHNEDNRFRKMLPLKREEEKSDSWRKR